MFATRRLRALSTLASFASLLVDPSRGIATAHLVRGPRAFGNGCLDAKIHPSRSAVTAARGRAQSAHLVSIVASLRGGSPVNHNGNGNAVAMVTGGEMAAAALDVLQSTTAHVPLAGPILFAQVRFYFAGKNKRLRRNHNKFCYRTVVRIFQKNKKQSC